jgi:diaminopimelate epimerase
MNLEFYKYQGTGNDFVMIDNRQQHFNKNNTELINTLCDRRFGVGGDGLILLEEDSASDFKMVYFNADGNESTMCGNGGRCIVAFAKFLGIIATKTTFNAVDGLHKATIRDDLVELQMIDVVNIEAHENFTVLDTGSPHYVTLVDGIKSLNIAEAGANIRYSEMFKAQGINVNFVSKISDDTFRVRTYERGVEDETLSCGTGVTAVALAMHYIGETEKNLVKLQVEGGMLEVRFEKQDTNYTNIWLIGKATQVYKGQLEC